MHHNLKYKVTFLCYRNNKYKSIPCNHPFCFSILSFKQNFQPVIQYIHGTKWKSVVSLYFPFLKIHDELRRWVRHFSWRICRQKLSVSSLSLSCIFNCFPYIRHTPEKSESVKMEVQYIMVLSIEMWIWICIFLRVKLDFELCRDKDTLCIGPG